MNYQNNLKPGQDPLLSFSLTRDQYRQTREFHHTIVHESKLLNTGEEDKSYFTDISQCTRFLIAKDFDQEEALEAWKRWVSWRTTRKPYKISEDDVKESLATGKTFYFGKDREGCPCLYIIMKNMSPKVSAEIEVLNGIYHLELGCKLADKSRLGQLNVIFDMKGFSRKSLPPFALGLFIDLLKILQDNYPERLRRLIILNANWVYKALYAVIKPLLSNRTTHKFIVSRDHKVLHDYIDKENILLMHGGTANWRYFHIGMQIDKGIGEFEAPLEPKELDEDDLEEEEDEEEEKVGVSESDSSVVTPKNCENRYSSNSQASTTAEKVHLRPSMRGDMYEEEMVMRKATVFDEEDYYDCSFGQNGFYQGGCNPESDLIPFEKFQEEEIKSTGVVINRCSLRG